MAYAASIALIAAGVVLEFAVVSIGGVDVELAGLALIFAGDVALMRAVLGPEPRPVQRPPVDWDPRYLS